MTTIDPVWADRIRKIVAGTIAVAGTLLLFRVLDRAAAGTQRLADPELWVLLVLAVAVGLWIRAARRVR